ncbi:MAG: chemotaxis protein CheA [Deltaproteobacteria bacterium]|nr:chemotaxis protein CheA [Deltaproteobacteria bacterium]
MSESKRDINEFLAEVEDILRELSSSLPKLGEGVGAGKVEPSILNSIFRAAHTLKGISGMFGFAEMQMLTHEMEGMLDSLRMGRLSVNSEIINALFEAVDLLNEMVIAKGKGEGFETNKVDSLIAKLNSIVHASFPAVSQRSGDAEIDKNLLGILTEYEEHRLTENIKAGNAILLIGAEFSLTVFDERLIELTDFLKSFGEVIATLPSMGESKEVLHFDILFGTHMDTAVIEDMFKDRSLAVKILKGHFLLPSGDRKEKTDIELPAEPKIEETTLRSMSNTVRVDIRKLDGIMNTVGELSQIKAAVSQIVNKLKLEVGFTGVAIELSKIDKKLEKRLNELQDSMIEVRLVPIQQLFDKFVRVIRKLSKELGKEVKFSTSGGDTELDKLIVEDLADPLMHIIRNAIDHGIETPAERENIGKPRTGIIDIKAYQKGNHVVIEIVDDGKGMDVEVIRQKAVDKGFVDEARSRTLSEQEMLEFIFVAGFSTKDEVSETSGRGVGMDVVKKNIAHMSGTVDIHTEKGQGAKIVITLPITLAIIQALIISAGARRYAIPLGGVMEILNICNSDIKTMEKREVIVVRGKTIPVVRLEQFFYPATPIQEKGEMRGIVVGLAESMLCILVGSIIGQQDVVIKSLGRIFKITGIAGATDLGDMGTLLVVDTAGVVAAAAKGTGKRAA